MSVELTARQHLEKRGAFIYFLAYIILFIFSVLFQTLAGVSFSEKLPGIVVNSFSICLSFYVYYKKKQGARANRIPWVLGFVSICGPVALKYNYAMSGGWTYAAQSMNSTLMIVAFAVMLYLFYQPNLFKFYSVFAIGNWISVSLPRLY